MNPAQAIIATAVFVAAVLYLVPLAETFAAYLQTVLP